MRNPLVFARPHTGPAVADTAFLRRQRRATMGGLMKRGANLLMWWLSSFVPQLSDPTGKISGPKRDHGHPQPCPHSKNRSPIRELLTALANCG